MDIEEEVKELIECHGEGDYIDFKEYDYHKENKEELASQNLFEKHYSKPYNPLIAQTFFKECPNK